MKIKCAACNIFVTSLVDVYKHMLRKHLDEMPHLIVNITKWSPDAN